MLVDALLEAAEAFPDRLAVADERRNLSYRQLTIFARVMRDIIAAQSAAPHVGVMLPATPAFAGTLMGALWLPRTVVPLNFLLSPAEIAQIVRDAGLDLIIATRFFEKLTTELPARTMFLEDLPLKRQMLMAMLRRLPRAPRIDPSDNAVILYTSGTSGRPKGVQLSYRNLRSNCDACIAALHMDSSHTFLNVLPPFHVFGLTATTLAPIVLKATGHCIPRFHPTKVIQAITEKKISIFMAIPSMYAAMLRAKSAAPDALRSLYLAFSGGEPLPPTVDAGMKERFGVTLMEGYGLTETSPVVSANRPDAYRAGTVGRPIPGVDVALIGIEDAQPLEPGTGEGEIMVRGPNVMKGYYQRPEETTAVLSPDGWFKTGDIGRIDADGFLSITGRKKEMLIIGGENVFPREIEAALEDHPAVADAAVIGIPDESRGELPVAFISLKEGQSATEIELRQFARERLAGYKVPKQVRIAQDLPRGPTGKILKRKLRELL
jgi:long-chain acyl-CoA synthetase